MPEDKGKRERAKVIGEDEGFQRHYWVAQRVGWALLALLLAASVAGLFGPGLIGRAHAADSASRLRVEYERFERKQAESSIRIEIGAGAAQNGEARVWLSREFLDRVQIHQITPEPESVETAGGRVAYVFRVADPTQPVGVTFHFEPEFAGRLPGSAGLGDGSSQVNFDQFVYP
ncbi:MAG: hypothetical protein ABR563_01210 [Pyrinomonadaceae bacterium]